VWAKFTPPFLLRARFARLPWRLFPSKKAACGSVAQRIERPPPKGKVAGSSPAGVTSFPISPPAAGCKAFGGSVPKDADHLEVEVFDVQRVLLDELAAGFHHIAHQL
jgi:hypothetical protein